MWQLSCGFCDALFSDSVQASLFVYAQESMGSANVVEAAQEEAKDILKAPLAPLSYLGNMFSGETC